MTEITMSRRWDEKRRQQSRTGKYEEGTKLRRARYVAVCLSVCMYVRMSTRPSVRLSVCCAYLCVCTHARLSSGATATHMHASLFVHTYRRTTLQDRVIRFKVADHLVANTHLWPKKMFFSSPTMNLISLQLHAIATSNSYYRKKKGGPTQILANWVAWTSQQQRPSDRRKQLVQSPFLRASCKET